MSESKTTNWNIPPYPPEEGAMCAALVKEIGSLSCWQDKVQAWLALLQVRSQAKSMRDERNYLGDGQCGTGIGNALAAETLNCESEKLNAGSAVKGR